MKKLLLSPWLALITLILLVGVRVNDPTFVESVRLRYFDTLLTSKPQTQSENIQIVNIDDETVKKYGQFPFPRDTYANIIEDIYSRGAGLVVWNIYMPDSDRFGQDSRLADTLRRHPVILPHAASSYETSSKVVPFRPGVSIIGSGSTGVNYASIEPNVKVLNESAAGIGIVNTLPEIDGVTRRFPMVATVGDKVYPSISLETLRVASGDPSFQIKIGDNGVQAVRIPKFGKIATDSYGRIWVDPSSKPIEYSGVRLPKDFGGKIVIVGLTAKGLNNPVATANGSVYPHYLQANVLDTLISGTNIERPDYADGAEILAIALAGIILLFLTRWTYVGLGAVVVFTGGALVASKYLFINHLWLFDSTAFIATIILVSLHAYGIKFVSELRQKLQIKKQFGTYLSPALVEKLQKNPELLRLGGESRELSIMFTDVRGFTTISEHYGEDVQGLTKIMNRYMTAMTRKILDNNGTLDKYIGDAQMAFWNAPIDDADHAKHAVKTAIEMLGDLDAFNDEIAKEGVPAFGMGLGINTGTVVVGNMGSEQRFDYTCLGDSVNLASRLEGQSKPYGVRIVLGQKTAELVRDTYDVTELDCIAVKGKNTGVKIFTLAKETKDHRIFLETYYLGDWKKAASMIPVCKKSCPDLIHYYDNMAERLWHEKPFTDGVYRATSK
jgi:adenylate cyclase